MNNVAPDAAELLRRTLTYPLAFWHLSNLHELLRCLPIRGSHIRLIALGYIESRYTSGFSISVVTLIVRQ